MSNDVRLICHKEEPPGQGTWRFLHVYPNSECDVTFDLGHSMSNLSCRASRLKVHLSTLTHAHSRLYDLIRRGINLVVDSAFSCYCNKVTVDTHLGVNIFLFLYIPSIEPLFSIFNIGKIIQMYDDMNWGTIDRICNGIIRTSPTATKIW